MSAGGGFVPTIPLNESREPVKPPPPGTPVKAVLRIGDPRIESIREHLKRYRDLTAQGKMVEAARELEAIQNEVQP